MNQSVAVRLEQESVGPGLVWPPIGVECLWVRPVDRDRYVIDNIPFFAKGIGIYDTIIAWDDPEMGLVFSAVQTRSGYSTVHVFPGDAKEDHTDASWIIDTLAKNGCLIEKSEKLDMIAIAVPPTVELEYAISMLAAANAENVLEYDIAHDGRNSS